MAASTEYDFLWPSPSPKPTSTSTSPPAFSLPRKLRPRLPSLPGLLLRPNASTSSPSLSSSSSSRSNSLDKDLSGKGLDDKGPVLLDCKDWREQSPWLPLPNDVTEGVLIMFLTPEEVLSLGEVSLSSYRSSRSLPYWQSTCAKLWPQWSPSDVTFTPLCHSLPRFFATVNHTEGNRNNNNNNSETPDSCSLASTRSSDSFTSLLRTYYSPPAPP
eukprot:CAMPEP_0182463890 /NCGR_PEP_ID=MMETSP1319-20130603/8068_1 /TAXON_ID=172717 /ORGANISM="Bolidomonas pacifica, Strain RCC208" /LENGTH=214 /DNA_ID=CAMNT_0024663483 /DNA_START=227 /DNA_END=867 /DNA_ORIENTATION=-